MNQLIHQQKVQILYITYDGLLDPLGSSQILPYVKSISQSQGGVVILSFEKPARLAAGATQKTLEVSSYPIVWKSLRFTSGFGSVGKVWDLVNMYFWGVLLAQRYGVRVVHARGHLAAQIGLFIKRILGAKLLFDFRGLWVDERVDKGGWDLSRTLHRLQYQHYKRVERQLLHHADQVVVLTNKVVDEVVRLGANTVEKVTVIPCCADFEHFPLVTDSRQALARSMIGIPREALVLGYLGSVGRMYMLDRFFRLFQLAAELHEDCHALMITQDVQQLLQIMDRCLPRAMQPRVHIKSPNRQDVPNVIPAMDILVSFIEPSYARMAASPTKLAECFAEGIPTICNDGVGDVAVQIEKMGAGITVDPASDTALRDAVAQLEEIRLMGGQRLRDKSRSLLGLEYAEKQYLSVYTSLQGQSQAKSEKELANMGHKC